MDGSSDAPDTLLDRHLPDGDFEERHRRLVHAPIGATYEACRHLDFSRSWITRSLLRIRGIRVEPSLDSLIERGDFRLIDEQPPHEFVLWLAPRGLEIAWNFALNELASDRTEVVTVTRVRCLTTRAKRGFRLYWLVIRPFSGLIRREMLRCVAAAAERRS